MAVYVDRPRFFPPRGGAVERAGRKHGHRWSHMWADSQTELVLMGKQLGLKSSWMQVSNQGLYHFDLVPTRRAEAIRLGAVERSLRSWIREHMRKSESTQRPEHE